MPTDPARIKRTDPGNPELCPVWDFHKVYSDAAVQQWVQTGCRNASIGCVDCKRPVIDEIKKTLEPIQTSIVMYESDLASVKKIVAEGSEQARELAMKTMNDVREAMGLEY